MPRLSPRNPSEPSVTIALVGRPNVGKSTLFNRLTGSRSALVTKVPGTTRDRRREAVRRYGYAFMLVDTGGMAFDDAASYGSEIESQVRAALEECDLVWIVVDGSEGLNPFDEMLYREIAIAGKPHCVLVNKTDNAAREANIAEFYKLGTEELFPVTALHGRGIAEVLQRTAERFPDMREPAPDAVQLDLPTEAAEESEALSDSPQDASEHGLVRVAFVGRPNVGKSSLVNHILGAARMIVSPEAGTTREAIATDFSLYERDYSLVDTAGIRRKARTTEHVEKIGVLHSIGALQRADVGVLVLDATQPVADQDARIASYILEERRAVVIALNKWDQLEGKAQEGKEIEADVRYKLRFLEYAALVKTSAATGFGLKHLFKEIDQAMREFNRQIQTADLNRVIQAAVLRFPPPAKGRSQSKIFYGSQVHSRPPRFQFFTTDPKRITPAYTRFFENQLRYHFGLKGTPIGLEWRGRREEDPARPRPAKLSTRSR